MIGGKIKGGLGNQLFQYAFLKALSFKRNIPNCFYLDTSIYLNKNNRKFELKDFNIVEECCNKNYTKQRISNSFDFGTLPYKIATIGDFILDRKYFFERSMEYIDINKLNKYDYFDGYWQSEKYFEFIRKDLLKDLELKNSIKLEDYIITNRNTCAIGFRRGDYFKNKKSMKQYDICSEEYYKNAITYIKKIIKDPIFYIFSDDLEWVKNNFDFGKDEVYYVNEKKELSPAVELKIMSKCKNAIIPNSTFSWWGAWLIENEEKIVVCPKGWYANKIPNDIIPEAWVQLDGNGEI